MNDAERDRIEVFLQKWQGSSGNERANYQSFLHDLCDALGVDRSPPKGSVIGDPYCFDKDIKIYHPSGKTTPGYIDFYKADHFLLEAKQGSDVSGKGTAKRGTTAYRKAMEAAFVQAVAYIRHLPSRPPFLITCDIGDHFELWLGFNGDYGGYGARRDMALADLRQPDVFDLFVDIFTNPQARNPEKIAARVTREVAADLAELAKTLERSPLAPERSPLALERSPLAPLKKGGTGVEKGGTGVEKGGTGAEQGQPDTTLEVPLLKGDLGGSDRPQQVAQFLMRCIFTMFAEDVGLLKEQLFTEALEQRWLLHPKSFKPEAEALWRAMNDGTSFGFGGKLLRFNGGLFAEAGAFELTAEQLRVLLKAAKRDWRNVEPAIFGTLLERALDVKERSKLGAHYTPRSYVERLVRPVVMEPLREQWDLVQAEVKQILGDVEIEPTAAQKKKAVAALEGFLAELRRVKILDPACGSGNFLYVTLDLIKQLESEVLRRLEDMTGRAQMQLDYDQVNPAQFLGIELNPRAAAIADLVIWIGYLQWHFRRFGDIPPVEPVLREYKNIECRDAVLAYDGREPDLDAKTGHPRTRWGGRLMKHPVTGEDVPDPSDQMPIYRYINPRMAEWPEADYVVSNPPFLGKLKMLFRLGEGYVKALRESYKNEVPDSSDFVMYWWYRAVQLVAHSNISKFGFVTTNSITQTFNRRIVQEALTSSYPICITFAIPDHPWVNSEDCAAVRIAMSACTAGKASGNLELVIEEREEQDSKEVSIVTHRKFGLIQSDLSVGANVVDVKSLKANFKLAGIGVMLGNDGFLVPPDIDFSDEEFAIKRLTNGNDILKKNRNLRVIDFCGMTINEAQVRFPKAFQQVLLRVKPERDLNNRGSRRENWWLFAETMPKTRDSISKLKRYIPVVLTAKHRVFTFLDSNVVPDVSIVAIALEDAYFLGVLSSKIHVTWALAAGGRLGVGNDPRYNKTVCFDPFPFPDPTEPQTQKIRELGERLDSHRKRVQAQHPDVTITAMYNLLEKIRAGEPLTDKDRDFNNKALVSTLKQIHDELDAAVFEAYGWEDLAGRSPLTPLKKGGTGMEQSNPENPNDNPDAIPEVPLFKGDLGGSPSHSMNEQILSRLVALNAQRAEEERNGLVRWLRPDYQAPGETQTQQVIEGIASVETQAIIPVEQQPFPKAVKDQLATLRDLLRTQGGEWTIDQLAAQFKGGKKKAIQDGLDSLEALGIIICNREDSSNRWYFADLQQVS